MSHHPDVRRTRGGRRTPPRTLDDVLSIDQEIYDAIVAHAKKDHPDEACGVVAGPEGSDRAERFVPMVNAAGS
ncbi:MAG: Mov34/MPN/PAD-1 family protein, partial [Nocardioidaceae bacterium]